MGSSVFPASGGSPIKSIQRGQATTAGNITVSSFDVSKSFVRSFSNGAAGSASISGGTSGTLSPSGGGTPLAQSGNVGQFVGNNYSGLSFTGSRSISGGTTTITSKEQGVYIVNSTTLTATGPCYWELVEYN